MNKAKQNHNKKYMSVEEAAEYFSLSPSFIYKNHKKWEDNKVKVLKAGKKVLLNIKQLEEYLTN